MAPAGKEYDFFVSYARKDNANGWIDGFLKRLQEEQRQYSGGREFTFFFDKEGIRSLDDWRHRIYESLAASRLLVAFISPAFLASEWCLREWRSWIDIEIAKHVLSQGAAPIYIVEVPWLNEIMTEQQVAEQIAKLSTRPADTSTGRDTLAITAQLSQRQLTTVQPFYDAGLEALRQEDLRRVLVDLAQDLTSRSAKVEAAALSKTTIPPYNRRFVGRLDELSLLRQRLHQGRTGVIAGHKGSLSPDKASITSVHGLGGIGKTELAFTYAHAFAGLYPGGRFLVPCDGRSDLRRAVIVLDAIFRAQISDEQRKELDLHFAAIRECLNLRLRELGKILLVLDNVTDRALISAEQTDFLRTLGSDLHLLATTRLAAVESTADDEVHWLTLGELHLEDSLRLLEKYRDFDTEEEKNAAERIAHRLGGFALCVEVVGAYLAQHREQNYARFLESMGLSDLEQVDRAGEGADVLTRRHNNEKRLGAILTLTLASLSRELLDALKFAAFLPPDHVVLPWLRQLVGGTYPQFIGDGAAWNGLIRQLGALALLTRAQDGDEQFLDESHQPRLLRCHRLLQDFMGARLDSAERERLQQAVTELIKQRGAVLEQTTRWEEAHWELGPLGALGTLWAETKHPGAGWLLSLAGVQYRHLAAWTEAEPLLRRSVAVIETHSAQNREDLVKSLNNLALLLIDTNRLTEAEPLVRRALSLAEEALGPKRGGTAMALNTLGMLLAETNRPAEAEPLLHRALSADEQNLGPEHPKVAIRLSNLAQILRTTGRLAEAETFMRRALSIDEQHYGPDDPRVATRLNNLAMLLAMTERPAEAESLHRRALAIYENNLGPDHPSVATSLNNLAQVLHGTGRAAEAETMYRRALVIDEKSHGPDHPVVAKHLHPLAQLLQGQRQFTDAESLMRRALAIDDKAYGPNHPSVGTGLNNLAMLLNDAGRMEDAEPLMERALRIKEQSLGLNHPDVAICYHNLGLLYRSNRKPPKAEAAIERAVEILLRSLLRTKRRPPGWEAITANYHDLLAAMGYSPADIRQKFDELATRADLDRSSE